MHLVSVIFKVQADEIGDLALVIDDDDPVGHLSEALFELFDADAHSAQGLVLAEDAADLDSAAGRYGLS